MDPTTPNRDLSKLDPDFRVAVEAFLKECHSENLPVFVTEGWRSKLRHLWLWSFGRYVSKEQERKYLGYDSDKITETGNKHKRKVTWTLNSNHLKGVSIDIAFNKPFALYPSEMETWDKVYDIAERHGLISLFRKSGYDKPHFNFDPNFVKPEHWGRKYEKKLIDGGIIRDEKILDDSPSRAEVYKIVVNIAKKLGLDL